MRPPRRQLPKLSLRVATLVIAALFVPPVQTASHAASGGPVAEWSWPVAPPRILETYRAPAHAYGPGHRGIDVAAAEGAAVAAPDDGVVAFAGRVAGRGVLTIDHGDGIVSSFEPIDADVAVGDSVHRGQVIGRAALGGHTDGGELHIGARQDGEYVNPLRFLGGIPRAVLLPCCGASQEPG